MDFLDEFRERMVNMFGSEKGKDSRYMNGVKKRYSDSINDRGKPEGSWGTSKPSVLEMFSEANDSVNNAELANVNAAEEAKESSLAEAPSVAAPQYDKPGETSKIDPVTDRYQGAYDRSKVALRDYEAKNFGRGMSGEGGSAELAAYNSPERGSLIRDNRQAFRLLQSGSFADKSNVAVEERQKNAAAAKNSMSTIAYQKALGTATLRNSNTAVAEEARKNRESLVAEGYLKGKKKKTGIDDSLYDGLALNRFFPN